MSNNKIQLIKQLDTVFPSISYIARNHGVIFESHNHQWGVWFDLEVWPSSLMSNLIDPHYGWKLSMIGTAPTKIFCKTSEEVCAAVSKNSPTRGGDWCSCSVCIAFNPSHVWWRSDNFFDVYRFGRVNYNIKFLQCD